MRLGGGQLLLPWLPGMALAEWVLLLLQLVLLQLLLLQLLPPMLGRQPLRLGHLRRLPVLVLVQLQLRRLHGRQLAQAAAPGAALCFGPLARCWGVVEEAHGQTDAGGLRGIWGTARRLVLRRCCRVGCCRGCQCGRELQGRRCGGCCSG